MFNRERFHNELAMRLGYQRIVNEKGILISIDDSDDPWITLKLEGYDDIRFNAADIIDESSIHTLPDMQEKYKLIADAAHQAYVEASRSLY